MFKAIYVWFVLMINKMFTRLFKRPLPAQMGEVKDNSLKLNLQYFAKEDDDSDNDDGDDDSDDDDKDDDSDEDETPNLDELLKDKKFKRQYQEKVKKQLGKRMKKFKDVDPEEYRRLKEKAGKKKDKDDKEEDEELNTLKNELSEKEKRLVRAERTEKRAMVKEFAVDNQVNPKLLSRLINVDDIELDDDGEPENLDDLFDELEEEFPEYFGGQEDDDEEEDDKEETTKKRKKKKSSYNPG